MHCRAYLHVRIYYRFIKPQGACLRKGCVPKGKIMQIYSFVSRCLLGGILIFLCFFSTPLAAQKSTIKASYHLIALPEESIFLLQNFRYKPFGQKQYIVCEEQAMTFRTWQLSNGSGQGSIRFEASAQGYAWQVSWQGEQVRVLLSAQPDPNFVSLHSARQITLQSAAGTYILKRIDQADCPTHFVLYHQEKPIAELKARRNACEEAEWVFRKKSRKAKLSEPVQMAALFTAMSALTTRHYRQLQRLARD